MHSSTLDQLSILGVDPFAVLFHSFSQFGLMALRAGFYIMLQAHYLLLAPVNFASELLDEPALF